MRLEGLGESIKEGMIDPLGFWALGAEYTGPKCHAIRI